MKYIFYNHITPFKISELAQKDMPGRPWLLLPIMEILHGSLTRRSKVPVM